MLRLEWFFNTRLHLALQNTKRVLTRDQFCCQQWGFPILILQIQVNNTMLKPFEFSLVPQGPAVDKWNLRQNENVTSFTYRSPCLCFIYFSFSHTADLILHHDPSAGPLTAKLGVMFTYHTRAAAYKLVPLGVLLALWSQWPLANFWLNMWGSGRSVNLLKAALACLSVSYGWPYSC